MKKKLALYLAAVLMLTALTACVPSSTGNPTTSGAPGSQPSVSGIVDGEKKVIRFAHTYDPNSESGKGPHEWVTAGIAKFVAENPEYTVEEEYYGMNEIDAKLMGDHMAGVSHDLVSVNTAQLAEQISSGSLQSMSSYFDALDADIQADFTWLNDWENYLAADGSLMAMPYTLHTRVIAYNKDLFAAAGLDPERPPQTMEELIKYAKILTTDDVWGYGTFIGAGRATAEISFGPFLWNYGGDFLDADNNATFASSAGVSATQFLYDLIYTHKVTPEWALGGDYFTTIRDPFLNGQYAMCDGVGNFIFNELEEAGMISGAATPSRDAKTNNIGFFIGPEGSSRYVNGWAFGIAESCEDPEGAFKLMMCLYDPEVYKIGVGGFPVRQSMFEQDIYQGEFWDVWKESLSLGRAVAPTTTYAMQLCDAVAASVQECLTSGGNDIESILQRHQNEYNRQYGGK